jgi:transposase-like protein
MIAAALKVEADDYVARFAEDRDSDGRALVVRNGSARPRAVTTRTGKFALKAPRVNDKRVVDGKRQALPVLLGDDAAGLSPSAITRLTHVWREEYAARKERSLADRDYVYVWVDGVHFNIRLEEDRLAALVVVGVRPDGSKELVAIDDGYRESTESWATLLRGLKGRGMKAPVIAIGDGALGFWAAVRQVWPKTLEQRCWFHKMGNVLDKLPKRLHPQAKRSLNEMMYADSRANFERELASFVAEYQSKYPKAVEALVQDKAEISIFFDFPADHWKHLRTTNPIESTFSRLK